MRMKILIFIMLTLFPFSSNATNPCFFNLRYFERLIGTCINANYFGITQMEKCGGFSYTLEQNQTVQVGFHVSNVGNIYFGGVNKDIGKPQIENTSFPISTFMFQESTGKKSKIPASGKCEIKKNDNGTHEVSCTATTSRGPLAFHVISTTGEPEILDCEEQISDTDDEKSEKSP